MTTYYKVTAENGAAFHGGLGRWQKNRWRSVKGDLLACENGLHLCTRDQLIRWLGPVIWEAEVDGETLDAGDKTVARRARVVRRLDTWNERTSRLFAADCAEHVLPIFEKQHPDDDHPRKAIEATRAFARGEIGKKDWAAAGDAAEDAARAAAGAAAYAAWAAGAAAYAAYAAWAAAGVAAEDDFCRWATERLFDYLEGRAE